MKIVPIYKAAEDIQDWLYINQGNSHFDNLYINNWVDDIAAPKNTWSTKGIAFYNDDILVGWIILQTLRPTNVIRINSYAIINDNFRYRITKTVNIMLNKEIQNKLVPKIIFSTMHGTDAFKMYNKLVHKGRARIVGDSIDHFINQVGEYVDKRSYEILNPNFTYNKKENK